MQQVLVIHGGETFDTYEDYFANLEQKKVSLDDLNRKGWRMGLGESLGPNYEVIAPRMPNAGNAKYAEWKIWFEKYIPFLYDGIIFIGHSLGGIFLAKYLAENVFPKRVKATLIVAAPYGSLSQKDSLADFSIPTEFSRLTKQSEHIFLFHSTDDDIVPFSNLESYRAQLPHATVRTFTDRGHFYLQEEFPELVDDIKSLS